MKIARGLGFQLRGQYSINSFLEGWHTVAQSSELSWGNLAFALNKITEYRSLVGKVQSKAGMECMLCVLMFPWQFIAQEILFFFFKADAVYYAESYVRMLHDCETQLHCDISF